jgi:hypothetical protein
MIRQIFPMFELSIDGRAISWRHEMASIDPGLRSHFVETLDVALLRLRVQHRCGLGLNQKLPFVDAHKIS